MSGEGFLRIAPVVSQSPPWSAHAIMVSDAGCFYHFENVCIFTLFLAPVTAPSFLFCTKPITIFCISMLQNTGQVHPRNLYILLALQGFEEMNSVKHNN